VRNWPYVVVGGLVTAAIGAFSALWSGNGWTWVIPGTAGVGFVGVLCAWSVLRDHKLPFNATVAELGEARLKKQDAPRP
jgi:hypothetical protein